MRKLLLGVALGITSLLVGGTIVALVGVAVLAPLAATLVGLHRRTAPGSRPPRPASSR